MPELLEDGGAILTEAEFKLYKKLAHVWFHSKPEWSGSYFLSGYGGEFDKNGLPELVMICPAMGCDWSVAYRKVEKKNG
jgi:hypothetical protein